MATLPLEIWYQVFRHLDISSLKTCRKTSVEWKTLIDGLLFKFFYYLCNETTQEIAEIDCFFQRATIFNFDCYCPALTRSKSRNRFTSRFKQIKFQVWNEEPLDYRQLHYNSYRLLVLNHNITSLEIDEYFWVSKRLPKFSPLTLPNLLNLKITTLFSSKQILTCLQSIQAPSLKFLSFRERRNFIKTFEDYAAIYEFISNYSGSLINVELGHDVSEYEEYLHSASIVDETQQNQICETLKKLSLITLHIDFHVFENARYKIATSICYNLSTLVQLFMWIPCPNLLEKPVAFLIRENRNSLRHIRFHLEKQEKIEEILASIETCEVLEEINLDSVRVTFRYMRFPITIKSITFTGSCEIFPIWLTDVRNRWHLRKIVFANYDSECPNIYENIVSLKSKNPSKTFYIYENSKHQGCIDSIRSNTMWSKCRISTGSGTTCRSEQFVYM